MVGLIMAPVGVKEDHSYQVHSRASTTILQVVPDELLTNWLASCFNEGMAY